MKNNGPPKHPLNTERKIEMKSKGLGNFKRIKFGSSEGYPISLDVVILRLPVSESFQCFKGVRICHLCL